MHVKIVGENGGTEIVAMFAASQHSQVSGCGQDGLIHPLEEQLLIIDSLLIFGLIVETAVKRVTVTKSAL